MSIYNLTDELRNFEFTQNDVAKSHLYRFYVNGFASQRVEGANLNLCLTVTLSQVGTACYGMEQNLPISPTLFTLTPK